MKSKPRNILVIFSNRLDPFQKPRFVALNCDEKGNILKEHPLRSRPKAPLYDEVWENDDGKTGMASCFRFKRIYRHRLEKRPV